MSRALGLAAGLALLCAAAGAEAHDYWLTANPPAIAPGETVTLQLWLGEGFVAESEKEYLGARAVGFVHHSARGAEALAPAEGARPILSTALADPGGHLFALERDVVLIEIAPVKFTEYLEHEGMAAIIGERERLGESDKPGRERYSRYLKLHVQVGDALDEIYGATVGHALEIRLLDNPTGGDGSDLPVALSFRGQPLAGAPLTAYPQHGAPQHLTTGADGTAVIATAQAGVWLVRANHMIRCSDCEDAEWRSFWAAYTFERVALPTFPDGEPIMPRESPPREAPESGCGACSVSGEGRARPVLEALVVVVTALVRLRSDALRNDRARRCRSGSRAPRPRAHRPRSG